ncbi:TFIIB-type zinc ribbon-containing protein [Parasphingorhabdus sp.]|uniref:TFIIB-type zinc ribbon-containing protein n=1 Tax=Parasphingorhabdus sp. TaxID=2709688 RepID=UPI003FA712A4
MSERAGIEIDCCPICRGVWLDRGELDKIIERSEQAAPPAPPSRPERDPRGYGDDRGRPYEGSGYPPRKRKKSFLEELFD